MAEPYTGPNLGPLQRSGSSGDDSSHPWAAFADPVDSHPWEAFADPVPDCTEQLGLCEGYR